MWRRRLLKESWRTNNGTANSYLMRGLAYAWTGGQRMVVSIVVHLVGSATEADTKVISAGSWPVAATYTMLVCR